MNKKIKIILINLIAIMLIFTTKVSAYSASVNLSSNDKLTDGGTIEVVLKLENIDATDTGISVVKGKISYDKDVFEGYTLEPSNGWTKENATDTFLFEKQQGVTTGEVVATIKFKVKSGISKTEAEINFSNITASGIIKQDGGPGDIKVAGATVKVSKTEVPTITKEKSNVSTIKSSKTTKDELPHAGEETNRIIKISVLVIVSAVIYIRYRWYKDIK